VQGADLMVQCNFGGVVPAETLITHETNSRTVRFFDIFYSMDVVKSGFHHPAGLLWVRYPERTHSVQEEKVSIRSIAPAILELFDQPRPSYMHCDTFLGTGLPKLVASTSN
jgi:hypothetical protein